MHRVFIRSYIRLSHVYAKMHMHTHLDKKKWRGSITILMDSRCYVYKTCTVELWSLELACLEHQGSLELVRRSQQFPYIFNVKIHPRLEQRWLELKAWSAGRFFHVKTL